MSLLGKILAFLNVLAAVAFVYLASMDYQKRSTWSYSHFRHQLLLNGLPVDDGDNAWRKPGEAIVADVSDASMKQVFSGDEFAGAKPPKTQVEAVKSAGAEIKRQYDEAATPDAKRAILTKFLIPLQTLGLQRDETASRLQAAKDAAALDGLYAELDGYFQRAASPVSPNGGKRDYLERRRAIADLLFNLDPSNKWHDHVQTVVGVEEFIDAAARQAKNYQDMIERYRGIMSDDRDAFVKRHIGELPQLENHYKAMREIERKIEDQKALIQQHTVQRNARKAEADDLSKKIADQQAIARNEIATLNDLQTRLFALQQEYALTQAANEKLEQEIRAREQGR